MNPVETGTEDSLMSDRIAVRANGRIVLIRVADIDWIEASGDYVTLHVAKKSWLVREPITMVAQRYRTQRIARIHRSTLVNLDRITELRPLSNGEFTVVLRDGMELKMSRNFRETLAALVGSAR